MFGFLKSIRIYGGQVRVAGLDAVVAELTQATIERRGDDGSGTPIWSLRAVLSYRNDFFLNNASFDKKIVAEVFKDKEYEVRPVNGSSMRIEEDQVFMDEVVLWPMQRTPS